jgi:endoglycosylceramidase
VIALLLYGALHADGAFLRDATGGAVILRGVNVAGDSKVPPFRSIAAPSLMDPLPKWGVNVIRLLFTWEAYEPQPGQYDQNYLAYYRGLLQMAAERGVNVIVDFHQDAYSRFSIDGCGEGFPAWALPPGITPATPDNGPNCVKWGTKMIGNPTLDATWNGFYSDAGGVRSAFLQMVGSVAAAFADEPNVIGYDLLNEPGGDEVSQIGALYELEAPVIRAAAPDAILFVEPSAVVTARGQTRLPQPSFSNFVYAPHFYDPVILIANSWSGSDESASFADLTGKAAGWNAPLLLGEWGAPPATDQIDGFVDAMSTQLDLALAGATQWNYTPNWTDAAKDGWNLEDFSIVDNTGVLRANFVVRPYASRFAGTPTEMTLATGTLTVAWDHVPSAGATELFVPAAFFGGGVAFETDGVTCTLTADQATCQSDTAGPKRVVVKAPPHCGLTGAELLLLLMCTRLRRRSAPSRR